MKTKSFKIEVATPKRRGHYAPAERIHKDKKTSYNRREFKRGGYEL